jgi:hypothetical protein
VATVVEVKDAILAIRTKGVCGSDNLWRDYELSVIIVNEEEWML